MTSKKINFIGPLIIGLLITINSCKDEEIFTVGFDLTNTYNQDEVQIILDGQVLMDEPLQTDLSTSLATTMRVKKPNGKHTLKITVNDIFSKTEVISLKDDLYINVSYNPATPEISFNYSDQPSFYD